MSAPAAGNVSIPRPEDVMVKIKSHREDGKRLNRLYRLACDTYGKPAEDCKAAKDPAATSVAGTVDAPASVATAA